MSLTSSMAIGTSGLDSATQDLDIIGNNVANADTIGFKESRADFAEAFADSLIGGTGQVGTGTEVAAVQNILTQGTIVNTGVPTDLALQGGGYFVVNGSYAGVNGQYYTRDGSFSIDQNGNLVNSSGLDVQGFMANAGGGLSTNMGNLQVGKATFPPQATANVSLQANLQADAAVGPAFDPTNPAGTSNFSTSLTIYDSLGVAHSTTVYFTKTAAGQWSWNATTDGGGLSGGTAGTQTVIASGTLSFDSNGNLTGSTQSSSFTPAGATSPQALNFNFGSATSPGVTQFAGQSEASFVSQDGYASGSLSSIAVDSSGNVTGTFSNGQSRRIAQVAVASFAAPTQLAVAGGNLFADTPSAGQPSIGAAGTGSRGSIQSAALEESNVDIATEFVNMISAQRDFEANSKTITTADQLLSDLISIKH
jgi:flagellar hook protein FlgE